MSNNNLPEKFEAEYDKFRVIQDREYISDFDVEVKRIMEGEEI